MYMNYMKGKRGMCDILDVYERMKIGEKKEFEKGIQDEITHKKSNMLTPFKHRFSLSFYGSPLEFRDVENVILICKFLLSRWVEKSERVWKREK